MLKLFEPFKIKDITLKNRIGMSPMCQYSAIDGFVNDWHLVHYATRSVGGVGFIMVEATAVTPQGRITPSDLGIWQNEHIEGLKQLASHIEVNGSVPCLQLAHAGRKASHDVPHHGGNQLLANNGGWTTIAPSALPFVNGEVVPHELTLDEILEVIQKFKDAATRALAAGFKIIEIHSAHGYLLHQFLSPISNHRTDEYGGTFNNRIRLLREVVKACKEVWPQNLPLWVRISATDYVVGGWDLDQSVALSAILKNEGVDLIDCSSGGNVAEAKIKLEPGYQVHFAHKIKQAGVPVSAVGLITHVEQVEEILKNEQADLVMLGRELLRNPYFCLHVAKQLGYSSSHVPIQYKRAYL